MIYVLGVALIVMSAIALRYKWQRDDLATAWVHFHPEDFPLDDESE